MEYASKEELYFSWWIQELIDRNIITSIKYQPKSFILSESVPIQWIEVLKSKTKQKNITLLSEHIYTADFLISWNIKVKNKIFVCLEDLISNPKEFPFIAQKNKENNYFSVIDVKGTFVGKNNSTGITFPLNKKWVFQKYGIYIQKVIPNPSINKEGKMIPVSALFNKTFVPVRFLATDKSLKERKIKYQYKTVDEYLKQLDL
jgi:hypothetical protein